jgi:hypothetical protein
MSQPLSDEYLKEVRNRCDSAIVGTWISFVEGRDHSGGDNVIVRGPNGSEVDLYLTNTTNEDQDFIAHAREDIPSY